MKSTIVVFLFLLCSTAKAQVAPTVFESGNKKSIYIYPDKKPYPYIIISEDNYNPILSFNVLISSTTVVAPGVVLFLENGTTLSKPEIRPEYSLSDVMGYSELLIKVPLNQSDVQILSEVMTDHLQIGNLPVSLTEELKSGLKDEIQIMANRINTSPEYTSPAVSKD
jgi:hypothetical protein